MYLDIRRDLLEKKKNFVFIGEAGSGKTETSLSLAISMAHVTDKEIHLLDMDQTKPNFRARDAAKELEQQGVKIHYHEQILDTPNVIPGVKEILRNPDAYVLMDIGGGSHGSHMIGQFYAELNKDNSEVLYIVNPYRPWSRSEADIEETMARVLGTSRLEQISLVANPNLGMNTTVEDITEGLKKIHEYLSNYPVRFVCALEQLSGELERQIEDPVLPINLNTLPRWMFNQTL